MQGMSTREPRAISDRLRPEMIHALLRGWAEHGSTRTGLVARRLACPGTKSDDLRLTPMGRQWADTLRLLSEVHATIDQLRIGLVDVSPHVGTKAAAELRAMVQRCADTMIRIRPAVWP